MNARSLGLIETIGLVPALEAADAACKSAMVSLLGYDRVGARLVTVKLVGDVGAVGTAVRAGAAAASKIGKVVATHVIARPDRQLDGIQVGPSIPPGGGPGTPRPSQGKRPAGTSPRKAAGNVGDRGRRTKADSSPPKIRAAKPGKAAQDKRGVRK